MKTSILLDYETVADGGYFVRLVLLIDGAAAPGGVRCPSTRRQDAGPLLEPSHRISARNVLVVVRPGQDAGFIQMTHRFSSAGAGSLLTILVGDVYEHDRIRIRMDALVDGGSGARGEADVAHLMVMTQREDTEREPELERVSLPIRLARGGGGPF